MTTFGALALLASWAEAQPLHKKLIGVTFSAGLKAPLPGLEVRGFHLEDLLPR